MAMTDSTKALLRLLAYEGEVEVESIADRTGMPLDEIRAAAIEGLFEVWALESGKGEPVTLKLTNDGYYTARQLLRSERAVPT